MTNLAAYINDETPVLIDFYSERSYPCKTMCRILEELKPRVGDRLKIIRINVDKNPRVLFSYCVKTVPELILFRKGRMQWRWSGIVLTDELLRIIQPIEQQKTTDYESH